MVTACSLRNGVLGKLTRQHETNGSLDLARRKSSLLVVGGKLSSLTSDTSEDIVDEGVHYAHGSLGDTGFWVNLLQDSVDIDGEGLCSLLVSSDWSFLSWGVSSGFSWHFKLKLLNEL